MDENDLCCGEGTYTMEKEGIKITYTGSFVNNMEEGFGVKVIEKFAVNPEHEGIRR